MRNCPKCEKEVGGLCKFCIYCGDELPPTDLDPRKRSEEEKDRHDIKNIIMAIAGLPKSQLCDRLHHAFMATVADRMGGKFCPDCGEKLR